MKKSFLILSRILMLLSLILVIGIWFFDFQNVITNVISDLATFLVIAIFIILLSRFSKLEKAEFFGYDKSQEIKICISENDKDKDAGRQANVHEYQAAIKLEKELLQANNTPLQVIIERLLGLIGQEPFLRLSSEIITIPHNDKPCEIPPGNIIVIGGPEANRITQYLQAQNKIHFVFSKEEESYQELANGSRRTIDRPCAFVERTTLLEDGRERSVMVIHGHGALETESAVDYLIKHWEELYRWHGTQDFEYSVPLKYLRVYDPKT